MPDIVQRGLPVKQVREEVVEPEIRKRCGGDLCVKITEQPRDLPEMREGLTRCEFWATDPSANAEVKRGETIVLVVGPNPCEQETPATAEPNPAPAPSPGGE